ncbi:hypothetical protein GYMLUDRAFT_39385 [Collybiopsis luxurians FD-317 M1]|nr:hypothetical protein GYMLUDRAFT_39385 [Collybiopsis luxurians FD-317 M1]
MIRNSLLCQPNSFPGFPHRNLRLSPSLLRSFSRHLSQVFLLLLQLLKFSPRSLALRSSCLNEAQLWAEFKRESRVVNVLLEKTW